MVWKTNPQKTGTNHIQNVLHNLTQPSVKKRIIGIDVARALAVIGMIVVNFKIVIGENGLSWVKSFASLEKISWHK